MRVFVMNDLTTKDYNHCVNNFRQAFRQRKRKKYVILCRLIVTENMFLYMFEYHIYTKYLDTFLS